MPLPADTALTLKQFEDLFQALTCTLLGIDVSAHPDYVRISWPTGGAPAWLITDDIVFLQVTEIDNPYNRQREVKFDPYDTLNADQVTNFTRVMQVAWTLYGPNSFDHSQTIRDTIFYQTNHDTLAVQNIFLIPDIYATRRIPELFQGQWWERTDLSMKFNELIIRNLAVPYIQSADITVQVDEPPVTQDAEVTSTTIVHSV